MRNQNNDFKVDEGSHRFTVSLAVDESRLLDEIAEFNGLRFAECARSILIKALRREKKLMEMQKGEMGMGGKNEL